MRIKIEPTSLLLLSLFVASAALGQRATELYIPIGESPGVSGAATVIGEIAAMDRDSSTMTVKSEGTTFEVEIVATTKIYIDRSRQEKRSTLGELSDCQQGLVTEVKRKSGEEGQGSTFEAEWIKVRPGS